MKKPNFKIDEITLVLVGAVLGLFLSVYDKPSKAASMSAEEITSLILDNHAISFANNGIIDESKLKEIQSMDYTKLKQTLNARSDFCMYIVDEQGKVVLAKGAEKLSKDGLICSE